VIGVAPPPAGALLIAARTQRKLVDNDFALAQVGERQHRDPLRRGLLIIGGNCEFCTPRIKFNDAVVPGFSTMRRYLFFGQEEWARLVLCGRCRATGEQRQRQQYPACQMASRGFRTARIYFPKSRVNANRPMLPARGSLSKQPHVSNSIRNW
jgi:hypothetical protein